jgi:hypothetical protein
LDPAFECDDLGWVGVRWCLISALVGPVPVVVVFVGGEDVAGVVLAEQQDVVGAVVAG